MVNFPQTVTFHMGDHMLPYAQPVREVKLDPFGLGMHPVSTFQWFVYALECDKRIPMEAFSNIQHGLVRNGWVIGEDEH